MRLKASGTYPLSAGLKREQIALRTTTQILQRCQQPDPRFLLSDVMYVVIS